VGARRCWPHSKGREAPHWRPPSWQSIAQGHAILDEALGADSAFLADIAGQAGGASGQLLPLLVMLVGGYVSAMAAGHGAGPKGLDPLLG
jgi:hypothetical protein